MALEGWQGFGVALIGLTLFEATVSSSANLKNAAGLTSLPAAIVKRITDPTVSLWGTTVASTPSTSTTTTPAPVAHVT